MFRITPALTLFAILLGGFHHLNFVHASIAPIGQVKRYSHSLQSKHDEISQISGTARDAVGNADDDDDEDENENDDDNSDDDALQFVTCVGDAGISSFIFFIAVNKPDGLFLLGGELNPAVNDACKESLPDTVIEEATAFYRRNADKCLSSSLCSVGPEGCRCKLESKPQEICEVRARVGLRNEIQDLLIRECSTEFEP